jgi:hypothetical protein
MANPLPNRDSCCPSDVDPKKVSGTRSKEFAGFSETASLPSGVGISLRDKSDARLSMGHRLRIATGRAAEPRRPDNE